MDRDQFQYLLSMGISEGYIPPPLRSVYEATFKHNPEFVGKLLTDSLAAVADTEGDVAVADLLHGHGGSPLVPVGPPPALEHPVSSFGSVEDAAAALGVPLGAVGTLREIDQQVEQASAEPKPDHPHVPFLNYARLPADATEPYNDAHYERDVLRARAANLTEPTREVWELMLSSGCGDVVATLWEERRTQDVSRLLDWRYRFIEMEQTKLAHQRQNERERREQAAAVQAAEQAQRHAAADALQRSPNHRGAWFQGR